MSDSFDSDEQYESDYLQWKSQFDDEPIEDDEDECHLTVENNTWICWRFTDSYCEWKCPHNHMIMTSSE